MGCLLIDQPQEVNNSETENLEARRYFQTECRRSAEEIVRFICSLRKEHFKEFWLPCMLRSSILCYLLPNNFHRQRFPSHFHGHSSRALGS